MFKIATWNVNSLRVRLPHVLTWLRDVEPHVLAVQETKLPDEDFPLDAIHEAGYTAIFAGQRTYNGVAIFSREKTTEMITDIPELDDHQRRVLGATIDGIRILNLYVPNGERVGSEKYQYKLNWLNKLDAFLKEELKKYDRMIVLGDFNIAPEEIDVHDPRLWEGQVLFSEPERNAFRNMLKVGFQDCFRLHSPSEKSYTWWDYRLGAFRRNMGLRIDHILASNALAPQCVKCEIDKAPRTWERPSDHVPVIAEFSI
ncbi:exodeoxyribonuclease III [Aquicella lusitana]|uniref:exodeoxyribonuclease III n=1 Tax=Aquicella lusitana TaxID=254246 RepID=UPI0018DA3167|nr:exodeoxyribonuclease III [Aquicella lusitana]